MLTWNPWHGCTKISPGCEHCYMYRGDEKYNRDPYTVRKTSDFDLPVRRDRNCDYKFIDRVGDGVFTCGTSDFFHPDADQWRAEAWSFIKEREDLGFLIITKRIDRFYEQLPDDWGDGYDNVTIGCTCENQEMADYRLPIFLDVPLHHRIIVHEPMLEQIDDRKYLNPDKIDMLLCGGESGPGARACHYEWILDSKSQASESHIEFYFKQTGALFVKDGRVYHVPRREQHKQAAKSGLSD